MGQQEVLDCLEKADKPLSSKEISLRIKSNNKALFVHLRKLIDSSDICCKEIDRIEARKKYGVKHKMNLYFVK